MTQSHRLAAGGRIDRSRPLGFVFEGRRHQGYAGDTLASALIANGVRIVARSMKLHRPRGILTAGVEEPNALVQLGFGGRSEPNARATMVELHDGLVAAGVNAWPSLGFDVMAVNQLFQRLLVAGFYYKTFKGPGGLWHKLYEPLIRRAAGFGRAPEAADPDRYDHAHLHCDVLVVGGGLAGLAAALAAGRTGARVILADEGAEPGGIQLGRAGDIGGSDGTEWIGDTLAALRTMHEVRVLPRTTVFGYYDHNYLCAVERRTDHLGAAAPEGRARQRVWHIRAQEVVLATGAHERPLVFADNDRPGVMLAGAVETYLRRYAAAPGRRAVVATTGDSAYGAAEAMLDAGLSVEAILDARDAAESDAAARLRARGVAVRTGMTVLRAEGARGVQAALIGRVDGSGAPMRVDCDLVAMSGGWSPVLHLFAQAQGRIVYDAARACFLPGDARQRVRVVGAAAGAATLGAALSGGLAAGAAAAHAAGFGDGRAPEAPETALAAAGPVRALWQAPKQRGKAFVDFQNDSTAEDIRLAAREGFEAVEHMKRYTLTGFGTDQGKTGNINGLAILAETTGRGIPATGTTTFRPPYAPVTFGALAGRDRGLLSDPVRETAIYGWHVAHGAVFENVGQWKRPHYFPRPGEDMHAAVRRECLAVRTGVGVLDASTLGKIVVEGPDAAEFLDRLYTGPMRGLAPGRIRYGLMCRDDGMIFDDGTVARQAPDRFFVTTTTGGAAGVMEWMEEFLQTEWPDLRVHCTSVTDQWATVSVAGPKSRAVLDALSPSVSLDPAQFPFMTFVDGQVAGIAARIMRVSFTGELSYEIYVPWHSGEALWRAVMEAGAPHGITPYGTETMHVLRAEKGFIIVGQETDGTVTPFDLGMDWAVSKKKPDFLGKRAYVRRDTARPDRKQLVGLLPETRPLVLPEGAQIVLPAHLTDYVPAGGFPASFRTAAPVPMLGHVTSSYFSPSLGRSFALALVKAGRARIGQRLAVPLPTGTVTVEVVEPLFYDREGARRDG